MNIAHIIRTKGRAIHSVDAESSVAQVIERFATSHVRSFLVLESDHLVGIVTIRDILEHLNDRGTDALGDEARDVMTRDLITVTHDTPLEDVQELFLANRFNHIPVVEDGRAVGVVTPRDVLGELVRESEKANDYMRAYIAGSYW